jgi:hypothetical protein
MFSQASIRLRTSYTNTLHDSTQVRRFEFSLCSPPFFFRLNSTPSFTSTVRFFPLLLLSPFGHPSFTSTVRFFPFIPSLPFRTPFSEARTTTNTSDTWTPSQTPRTFGHLLGHLGPWTPSRTPWTLEHPPYVLQNTLYQAHLRRNRRCEFFMRMRLFQGNMWI